MDTNCRIFDNGKYSKYNWYDSFISYDNIASILQQLENSNEYTLTDDEVVLIAKPRDLRIRLGYYLEPNNRIHHFKVTNDTRRNIIKTAKIREIVDNDSEVCVNCNSIDCSTCLQLHRPDKHEEQSRPGYIVICHSCGHKSVFK
jgi:hypothetical protein